MLTGFLLLLSLSQQVDAYRISVNVNLVVLPVTVHNHAGRFVPGLRQSDFEVYEDGVKQSIRLFKHDDIPVTVGLVVDHSRSMRRKLPEVISAARVFVQASSPQDQMFVVNFNDSVALGLPVATPFTSNQDELARALSDTPADGMTQLYDAVLKAQQHVSFGTLDKKALILISDGGDTASKHSLADVLAAASKSSALVYTIGIFGEDDMDQNPAVLKRLAAATGGEAFFPNQHLTVAAICEHIAQDIRSQYTLGYASSNDAPTGALRKIRVTAHDPSQGHLTVRTRSTYAAAAGEESK